MNLQHLMFVCAGDTFRHTAANHLLISSYVHHCLTLCTPVWFLPSIKSFNAAKVYVKVKYSCSHHLDILVYGNIASGKRLNKQLLLNQGQPSKPGCDCNIFEGRQH